MHKNTDLKRVACALSTATRFSVLQQGLAHMERFYFDLYNAETQIDEEGQLFPSRERAGAEALRILHDVARDEIPEGDHRRITVKMLNENREQIFEASLTMASLWS
ncbi:MULTISPECIES: hypothetical protein [unclassified Mesorhizobium]|uniref:DUF6894 family protein n=1 Tax=unclassified Mesorhizobium TaxID=325217 RepID=UPI0003CF7796|nr:MULTISPECIES: hypothetical protein [unclassified Mesorhizobium]ESY40101.1 hypothetical protein X746_27390 [Mesorhizobium sp. LNJC380A00]